MRKFILSLFIMSLSTFAHADVPRTMSRILDTFFNHYTSVYFDSLGQEIPSQILDDAQLTEVYRDEKEYGGYVVYTSGPTEEISVYYFHNGKLLFLLREDIEIDYGTLFSDLKTGKAAYAGDSEKPVMFMLEGPNPPKFLSINYIENERVNFDLHFRPNPGRPIYNYVSEIVQDMALYRGTIPDEDILTALGLVPLDESTYHRTFDDKSEIMVATSENAVGVSITRVDIEGLRAHIAMDFLNNLSQSFIPNLPDDKMQFVNDRYTVTLSVLSDVRGETLDIPIWPDMTSGVRMHFRKWD